MGVDCGIGRFTYGTPWVLGSLFACGGIRWSCLKNLLDNSIHACRNADVF